MTPPLKLIAAMSANRVIGRGDGMPWSVPEEYEHYRQTIAGQIVVMGRRSFEIFGADLTSRHAIVVSRTADHLAGAIVQRSLDAAIATAERLEGDAFINGGQSIYEQALPRVGEMHLSTIRGEYEGVAFFPIIDYAEWEVLDEQDRGRYIFRRYRRRP